MSLLGTTPKTGKKDKRYTPTLYVTDEPPVTLNINGKNITCRAVYPYGNYLLCVQFDGSTIVIQAPQQQVQSTEPIQQKKA
jgi:hypothetical protein